MSEPVQGSCLDANRSVRLCMRAGEMMLKSGAETNRVEDTMARILIKCGYEGCETFVTSTGLFAGVTDGDGRLVTTVGRVTNRSNNLSKVVMINELSREFAEGRISAEEMNERLGEIDKIPAPYRDYVKILCAAVACAAFAFLLDGSVTDSLNAFVIGLLIQTFVLHSRLNTLLTTLLGGGFIAVLSLIFLNIGFGEHLDKIIIGAIMPLLPGVAFTNAIRDILAGDYISGTARAVDAMIVAIGIAAGVGTVLSIWISMFGGVYL